MKSDPISVVLSTAREIAGQPDQMREVHGFPAAITFSLDDAAITADRTGHPTMAFADGRTVTVYPKGMRPKR